MAYLVGKAKAQTFTAAKFRFGTAEISSDKYIYADNGSENSPALKFNEFTDKWQFSNDGTTFNNIGSEGVNSTNQYSLGDGVNSDKTIVINNAAANKPKIKWNQSAGKFQYSNDGTTFVNFGDVTSSNSNTFTFGDGTSGNKTIAANTAAVNKPNIRYNDTSDKWEYSNDGTNYTDFGDLSSSSSNTFSIGDGTNGNKLVQANTAAVNKPAIRWNQNGGAWEYSNDGTNYISFGIVSTSENDLYVGDGTSGNKNIFANNADSPKPAIRYNDTNDVWEFSNDGTNFDEIGASVSDTSVGGPFDIKFTASAALALTASFAAIFTAPSDIGKRYIIKSLRVTNIHASNDGTVGAEINISGGASVNIANDILIPNGTSIELLDKPKVINPDDVIRLKADATSTLHATISYYTVSDANYYGNGLDIASADSYYDLLTASSNGAVIMSILASTDSNAEDKLTCVWTDGSNAIQGYLCSNMIVYVNSNAELMVNPMFIPNGHKIRVKSLAGNLIETFISAKQL